MSTTAHSAQCILHDTLLQLKVYYTDISPKCNRIPNAETHFNGELWGRHENKMQTDALERKKEEKSRTNKKQTRVKKMPVSELKWITIESKSIALKSTSKPSEKSVKKKNG